MDKVEIKNKLKTIQLFKKLDDTFFDKFIPILSIMHFKHGDRIIVEGESGQDMFILLKGTVRIVKKTISGDEYTAALLKDEYGIFFGEVGLLSEEKRSASVIAESPCDLAKLCANDFNSFVEKEPAAGSRILKELAISICQKLKKSNHDMVVLYEALINEIGQAVL